MKAAQKETLITSKDYEGRVCVLVFADGTTVEKNSTLISSRETKYKVIGGIAPHRLSSSGKVWVQSINADGVVSASTVEFYPGVFGARWVLLDGAASPARELLRDIVALDSNRAYADDTGREYWKQAMAKAKELAEVLS